MKWPVRPAAPAAGYRGKRAPICRVDDTAQDYRSTSVQWRAPKPADCGKIMANHDIQPGHGTYALFLVCDSVCEIQVGRLGRLRTQPGCYAYIGSAFGSGGISARIAHHGRLAKHRHWHIDYLRRITRPVSCWYTRDSIRREHDWAAMFAALPLAVIPLVGFGCSDCRCHSHLIRFPSPPTLRSFVDALGKEWSGHDEILETSLE